MTLFPYLFLGSVSLSKLVILNVNFSEVYWCFSTGFFLTSLHLQTETLAGSVCPSNGPSMDHCQLGGDGEFDVRGTNILQVRISGKKTHEWGGRLGGRECFFWRLLCFCFGKIGKGFEGFDTRWLSIFPFLSLSCDSGLRCGGSYRRLACCAVVWKLGRWFYFPSSNSNIPWDEGCYPAWKRFLKLHISQITG